MSKTEEAKCLIRRFSNYYVEWCERTKKIKVRSEVGYNVILELTCERDIPMDILYIVAHPFIPIIALVSKNKIWITKGFGTLINGVLIKSSVTDTPPYFNSILCEELKIELYNDLKLGQRFSGSFINKAGWAHDEMCTLIVLSNYKYVCLYNISRNYWDVNDSNSYNPEVKSVSPQLYKLNNFAYDFDSYVNVESHIQSMTQDVENINANFESIVKTEIVVLCKDNVVLKLMVLHDKISSRNSLTYVSECKFIQPSETETKKFVSICVLESSPTLVVLGCSDNTAKIYCVEAYDDSLMEYCYDQINKNSWITLWNLDNTKSDDMVNLIFMEEIGYGFSSTITDRERNSTESTKISSKEDRGGFGKLLKSFENLSIDYCDPSDVRIQKDDFSCVSFIIYNGKNMCKVDISWIDDLAYYYHNPDADFKFKLVKSMVHQIIDKEFLKKRNIGMIYGVCDVVDEGNNYIFLSEDSLNCVSVKNYTDSINLQKFVNTGNPQILDESLEKTLISNGKLNSSLNNSLILPDSATLFKTQICDNFEDIFAVIKEELFKACSYISDFLSFKETIFRAESDINVKLMELQQLIYQFTPCFDFAKIEQVDTESRDNMLSFMKRMKEIYNSMLKWLAANEIRDSKTLMDSITDLSVEVISLDEKRQSDIKNRPEPSFLNSSLKQMDSETRRRFLDYKFHSENFATSLNIFSEMILNLHFKLSMFLTSNCDSNLS